MNDTELERYSRHILLNEFDIAGQEKLKRATVLIVGCGGLANACTPILASAGLGHLIVCDGDTIESSNLQRQTSFTEADIGLSKAEVLKIYLQARNHLIQISSVNQYIDEDLLKHYLPKCDAVIDCSDNSQTRHLINRMAVQHRIPLISASVIQFSGQLAVFDSRNSQSPCYACLFPQPQTQENTCTKNGVFSPLVHIIGAAQAAEAMKIIGNLGTSSLGKIIHFEGLNFETVAFALERHNDCPVCQSQF